MRDISIGGSCRITCINNQRPIGNGRMFCNAAGQLVKTTSAGFLCQMPIAPKPVTPPPGAGNTKPPTNNQPGPAPASPPPSTGNTKPPTNSGLPAAGPAIHLWK
jgi:hypothetical protein